MPPHFTFRPLSIENTSHNISHYFLRFSCSFKRRYSLLSKGFLAQTAIDKKSEATMMIHSTQAICRTTSHLTRRMLLSTATEASNATAATTTMTTKATTTTTTSPDKKKKKRIVVAVGGNALQRRGDRLTIENMLKAAAEMAPTLAELAKENELVLTHGNGPQVGELALERSAASFDVLGAESMGQIGYVLAQAMQSVGCTAVPILTQVVVDQYSDAFKDPSKFVGPIYGSLEAQALAQSLGWTVKPDGEYFRRVVPSPPPMEILQIEAIKTLLEHLPGTLPIACGGGGIPVARVPANPKTLIGVEAVIDKDACGAKLANEIDADGYIILTDGGGIWENFGKSDAREMEEATPEYLKGTKTGEKFPGSMGPKVQALIDFVEKSNKPGAWAAVGDLKDCAKIVAGEEGTFIRRDVKNGVKWRTGKKGPPRKESKDPPPF